MRHLRKFTPFVTMGAARQTLSCVHSFLPLCFLMTFIYAIRWNINSKQKKFRTGVWLNIELRYELRRFEKLMTLKRVRFDVGFWGRARIDRWREQWHVVRVIRTTTAWVVNMKRQSNFLSSNVERTKGLPSLTYIDECNKIFEPQVNKSSRCHFHSFNPSSVANVFAHNFPITFSKTMENWKPQSGGKFVFQLKWFCHGNFRFVSLLHRQPGWEVGLIKLELKFLQARQYEFHKRLSSPQPTSTPDHKM